MKIFYLSIFFSILVFYTYSHNLSSSYRSSIFTSFSSFVTSVLIKQKPVEVEMTEANKENATWLNSPLLSQGLCSDSEDSIRKQCLALLNGDDKEWYDQITALKKVNKLND